MEITARSLRAQPFVFLISLSPLLSPVHSPSVLFILLCLSLLLTVPSVYSRFVSETVYSPLQIPAFLYIFCYLSAREFARSQPTAPEYLYGDPLTFKVYVNLQQCK